MSENQSKTSDKIKIWGIKLLRRSAFAMFFLPLIFLLFFKLIEIRVSVDDHTEEIIYGYAAVFLIPFAIGLILYILYITFSESKVAGIFGGLLVILLAVLSFLLLINKSAEPTVSLILMLLFFSLFFSFLLTLSIEYFYNKFKNWIFKDDGITVKDRLSFANKIILSIATTVASVLGIALTIKNLFS